MTDATLGRAGATPLPLEARERDASLPLALAIAVFTFVTILLMQNGGRMLMDPDTHWHVAVGRWIVEHGAFPRVDVFSHTHSGQPWIAKEWLSQLIMFGAHSLGGWTAVALMTALCLAFCFAYATYWLASRLRWTVALIMVLVMVLLATPSLLARPHIIALPMMLAWIIGVVNAADQNRTPHWALIPLMLVWSNAHAGYTIGFVVAGLLAAQAVINAGRAGWFAAARGWGVFLTLALIASAITPYGFEAILLTINLFGVAESLTLVEEWQPMKMDEVGWGFVLVAAALMVGLAFQPRQNLFRILIIALLTYMMVKHARFTLVFGFIAFFVAASPLVARFRQLGPEGLSVGQNLARLGVIAGVALVGFLSFSPTPVTNPKTTPTEALKAARSAGLLGQPVYNSYNFGGYLISHGVPTFIDGRSDQLFLNGFFLAYEASRQDKDPAHLMRYIAPHNVTWAIVLPASPEAQRFKDAGWRELFADDRGMVYVRPAG
jgi:hypothetical protein